MGKTWSRGTNSRQKTVQNDLHKFEFKYFKIVLSNYWAF